MLASRPYYHDQMEFFRRSDTGGRLALNSPLNQFDISSQLSRRTSPSTETDKSGAPSRKRVPVACERCRKRKIKCSGDEGGSCSNCRNAGHANTCAFLRVQSHGLDTLVPVMRHQMTRGSWHHSNRWQPYGHSSSYRHSYAASHPSYSPQSHATYQGLRGGIDFSPCSQTSQHAPWTRGSYSTYSPYDSESTSPYSSQPPSFMLPDTNPMTQGNSYLVNPYMSKPQSSQVWPESAASVSLHPPSQLSTSMYPEQACLVYNTGSAYGSSLAKGEQAMPYPPTASGAGLAHPMNERTLPTPGGRVYSLGTAAAHEAQPTSAYSHRSSIGWSADGSSNSSHISSQTSVSSGSISHDYHADGNRTDHGSQDLSFNLLGFAGSPQALSSSHPLAMHTNDNAISHTQLPSAIAELGTQRCRTVIEEEDRAHESPSTLAPAYGYAVAPMSRNHQPRGPSGQLSNGSTYTRAHQSTLSHRDSGTDECGPECSSYQPVDNRASIASINNVSTY